MEQDKHPVAAGLIALVSVALAIGVIVGAVAFGVTRMLGIGDADATSTAAADGASLYVPEPVPTETPDGPAVTLAPSDPDDFAAPQNAGANADEKAGEKKDKPDAGIKLEVSSDSVAPGGRIDLNGTFPSGDGTIVKVQRKMEGEKNWEDFPVNPVSVSAGGFSTYVMTERTGTMKFRVVVVDGEKKSNEVEVTVG